jgi:hypothetical protein
MKKSLLRRTFNRLKQPLVNPQRRGYEFEKLIFDFLDSEELSPSASYRTQGEQIDGFFEFENRFYLLEAKWTEPVSVSEVYVFRAKVEGKLSGTLGIFISMLDYTADVPTVLRYGKEVNVILFNGKDIELALSDDSSFEMVLKSKLRRAAQYGEVYYPYDIHLHSTKR